MAHTRKSRKIPRKSGGANNHRRAHCSQCSLSPLDRSTSPSKPFSTTLSHTSERISQQARLQTTATLSFSFPNSLFPRLHCCSLAFLFMYSLSSALGNAPLSSSILFLAMFHKPFCAVKRPTSNSSFRLFHSFLGKSFSFDFPPFHLSVSAKNMGPSHLFGISSVYCFFSISCNDTCWQHTPCDVSSPLFLSTKIHFCFGFGSSYSQSCHSSSRQRKLVAYGNPRVNFLSFLLNCAGPDLSYLLDPSLPHLLQTHLPFHCHLSDKFSKGDIFLHLLLGTAYLSMFRKIGPLQCSHSQVLGQKDMCECSCSNNWVGFLAIVDHNTSHGLRHVDMRHVSSRARSSFPRHLRFTLSVSC